MTIAAIVGVKDEVELIEARGRPSPDDRCRPDRRLRLYSTDGTGAILDRRAQEGEIEVVRMSDSVSQEEWSAEAVRPCGRHRG